MCGPNTGRRPNCAGSKNIVAAGGDERAADERGVSERVKCGEFADGIEDEHVGVVGERLIQRERAAAHHIPAAFSHKSRSEIESIAACAARGSKRVRRHWRCTVSVRAEHGFFFAGDDAACDEDGPALLPLDLRAQPICERAGRGRHSVILQITGDEHQPIVRAHRDQAHGVFLRLREKNFGVFHRAAEHWTDQPLPLLEMRERALRYARVRENHGDARAVRLAQKVWPDFRFHDDHGGGLDRAQSAAHGEHPVERKVEDAVGGREAFACEGLAGVSGGGNEDGARGLGAPSDRRAAVSQLELLPPKPRGSKSRLSQQQHGLAPKIRQARRRGAPRNRPCVARAASRAEKNTAPAPASRQP